MRCFRSLAPLAAALALGWLTPAPSQATTLLDQSVAQLSARAERVVIGRVVGVRSWAERAGGLRIYTAASIEVSETLKGPASPARLELTQPGGTAGEGTERRTQTIAGSPRWREGEVVLVFLEHTDTGRLVTGGLSLGKYTIEPGSDGRVMARRDVSELNRVNLRRSPERVFLGAPGSEDVLALQDLRRLIAGERVLSFPRVIRRVPDAPGAEKPVGPTVAP